MHMYILTYIGVSIQEKYYDHKEDSYPLKTSVCNIALGGNEFVCRNDIVHGNSVSCLTCVLGNCANRKQANPS